MEGGGRARGRGGGGGGAGGGGEEEGGGGVEGGRRHEEGFLAMSSIISLIATPSLEVGEGNTRWATKNA